MKRAELKRAQLKTKLEAKHARVEPQISQLVQKITSILKIQNKKKFTEEFESCIEKIKSGQVKDDKFKIVSHAEFISLESLFDKYIEILTPKTITLQDLKTLSSCFVQRFLIEDHFGKIETGMVKDSGKFCTLINQVKNNIINSQFDNRSLAEWDAILISMNNDFPFEKPKQAELLNLVVRFSEKGLLNTAYDSYKKLPKNTNTSALLADVFVASCEISQKKSDFTYLERAINLFKINLKELQIPTASLKCKAFSPFSFVTTIEQEHREGYVKLLVKLGLNPNDDIDHKSITLTPLMIACMQSQLDSVKILVKYGADVNLGTSLVDGIKLMYHTPFSAAVGSRNLELVEFLLENNANPVKAGALYKELNPQLLPFASDIDFFPTMDQAIVIGRRS